MFRKSGWARHTYYVQSAFEIVSFDACKIFQLLVKIFLTNNFFMQCKKTFSMQRNFRCSEDFIWRPTSLLRICKVDCTVLLLACVRDEMRGEGSCCCVASIPKRQFLPLFLLLRLLPGEIPFSPAHFLGRLTRRFQGRKEASQSFRLLSQVRPPGFAIFKKILTVQISISKKCVATVRHQ